MRIRLAVALACSTLGGLAAAADATAAIRQPTNIPAEGLGPALTTLAKAFDFQVLYRTEVVGKLRTEGVSGAMTASEALEHVLTGTGLTYKYLDNKTVTIIPVSTGDSGQSNPANVSGSHNDANASKEAGKRASQGFRVAQVDRGKAAGDRSIDQKNDSSFQDALQEITVTATRRSELISDLPFNISAYGGQQLEAAHITNLTELSQQVPNFVITDAGAGQTVGSIPIIRGINASTPTSPSARYFQSPVGFYLGNAPMTGSLPLQDVERVEVLRGPQGTLYGAGALAGAVRVIPTEPKLGAFSGLVSASGEVVSHSSDLGNDELGVINIPLGEVSALRLVVEREYDAGFIDQHDIMRRQNNNYAFGTPILANPSDVANSPAVYFNQKDANYTETQSARAMFLWKPNDAFKLLATYAYAYVNGEGTPTDNYTYPGGPSPIDPRITLAPSGNYQISEPMLQPYNRNTQMASLDLSYDVGFATLSATAAYGTTHGSFVDDNTNFYLAASYGHYYTGTPANPRFLEPSVSLDAEHNYTEEVRLVSKQGGSFDYTVGAFLEQNSRSIGELQYVPGASAQSAAAHGGSMISVADGGTWVGPLFANDMNFHQFGAQNFHDYSLYGDLTWHITDRWQVTGGARGFREVFSDGLDGVTPIFGVLVDATTANAKTGQIFKLNTSYELAPHNQIYATFSQGFRRGGANAVPLAGVYLEPSQLLTYESDKTNNYEFGIKGSALGFNYTADLFYIDWQNPQIDLLTPFNGAPVVINGKAAVSKGGELELSGPLGLNGLRFNMGLSYAQAELTQDFGLPAGLGGEVVPNAIQGHTGDRLPGAPQFSGSANVNYTRPVAASSTLNFNLGVDYRGSTTNGLPSPILVTSPAPGYASLRGGIQFDIRQWQLALYGNNLADKHVIIENPSRNLSNIQVLGSYGNSYLIGRPREVGLRLTWRW